jgi:hypothetical protein
MFVTTEIGSLAQTALAVVVNNPAQTAVVLIMIHCLQVVSLVALYSLQIPALTSS